MLRAYYFMKRTIVEYLESDKKEITVEAQDGEELTVVIVGLGEQGEKTVTVKVNGRGASAQILGIFLNKTGIQTLHTLQHHTKPDTTSDLLVKGVFFGDATFNYDGLIRIDKGAQRSNAYQRNENLLLSPKAHVNTEPELEIEANDVRCTHGATVGKIDEEVLFYLMSRGIDRKQAEQLFIEGFLESVLGRINEVNVANKIRSEIQNKLNNLAI